MKCCKLCDKLTDHQVSKLNMSPTAGTTSIFNPYFPISLDNVAAAGASIFVNTPHLRDMMMAACFLRGEMFFFFLIFVLVIGFNINYTACKRRKILTMTM